MCSTDGISSVVYRERLIDCCTKELSSRISDPDTGSVFNCLLDPYSEYGSGSIFGQRIRVCIWNTNTDPDPGTCTTEAHVPSQLEKINR